MDMQTGCVQEADCPRCHGPRAPAAVECPECGVVYRKYRPPPKTAAATEASGSETGVTVRTLLRGDEAAVHPMFFAGRVLVWLGLAVWSLYFVLSPFSANYAGQSFLHGVNLLFHEAGHVLFGFFGEFLRVLGGTLGQLLMPAICFAALLLHQRDPFGAAVALWWVAENLLDIAPYVGDARARQLMLLGGVTGRDVPGYHDWEQLLGWLGWLEADRTLALALHGAGLAGLGLALAWGAMVLVWQRRRLSWEG